MGIILFLIVTGSLLIYINVKAIKKDEKSFDTVLNKADTNIEDFDIKITALRKEFAETILELQKEIYSLKDKIRENDNYNDEFKKIDSSLESNKEIEEQKSSYKEEIVKTEKKESNSPVKVNEVEKLIKEGYTLDEISEKLNIGKGEVLLIKELYLK